jgi:hypothetical protein
VTIDAKILTLVVDLLSFSGHIRQNMAVRGMLSERLFYIVHAGTGIAAYEAFLPLTALSSTSLGEYQYMLHRTNHEAGRIGGTGTGVWLG